MTRIGVFGGSFDPVHRGHLYVALLAREAAGLDRVVFVPAARPPHKAGAALAPAADRLAMLRAALDAEPESGVSEVELAPGGPRYTVDTLAALRTVYPGAALAFILGMDSLRDLPGWREPGRILAEAELIAVDRPGMAVPEIPSPWEGRVRLVTGNPFAVSSTDVRRRAAAGLSLRHLVTAGVEAYILDHGLYRAAAR